MKVMAFAALVMGAMELTGCVSAHRTDIPAPGPAQSDDMRRMYLSMIRALSDQGKAEAALAFLDDYDMRFPKDPEARALRGEALLRVGERDKAQALFESMMAENIHPAADFGLGQARAAVGDWAGASEHFADAARLAPTNARYLNNYGYALLETDHWNQAFDVLARAHQLKPADDRTRNNFILAATRSNHEAEAEKAIASATPGERTNITAFLQGWSP